MDSERWQQVQSLFEAALDQIPSNRITFLKVACREDVELYREVASLLESDQLVNSLVDGHALEALTYAGEPRAGAEEDDAQLGERVGAYRVLRRLGAGGMGVVYLAERADGHFEQQVALKLIKRGMDSERIVQRFLAERQMLARLQHPNIARLLDGGMTDDGRPYFAMEYVDGIPLPAYARENALGIRERLMLFERVCDAVQHAHRNLIVHRDIKPGNILVTRAGEVKLLDFGIARALEEDADAGVPLTDAGMRVLTPEYAAPEQVRGGAVTTQTDIYALGVVLYELLAGVRPLKLSSHAPAEVEAVVCHQIPRRPSLALLHAQASEAPDGATKKAAAQLKGDLDTICLMALRKEPERRYSSAGDLRSDLERHRQGLPVSAQPDAWRYRASKFGRRHRTLLLAAALFLLLLGAVVLSYTLRLSEARDAARLEASKADEATRFMVSLFDAANPHVAQGDTLTAFDMLRDGAARIEDELADQPDVQARLLRAVGDAYHGLGQYREAESLFEKALALVEVRQGRENEEALYLLSEIANIRHSLSDFAGEDSLTQFTLAIRERLYGPESAEVAATVLQRASNNRAMGRFDVAMPLYRRAVAIYERVDPPDERELAWTLNNYGWALHSQGLYDEAEVQYRRAEAIQREEFGDADPDLAFTLSNLGGLYWTTGRVTVGEPIVRESLAIRRNLYGEEHPETIQSLNNLAGLLFRKGDLDEAEAIYRKTLEINLATLGPRHRYVASALGSVASVLRERGDLEESERLQRESLAIYRELFGDDHQNVASARSNLGAILRLRGRPAEAEAELNAALAFWRAQAQTRIEMAFPLISLGLLTSEQGDPVVGEALLQEAVAIRTAQLPAGDLLISEARGALGRCLALQGRGEEARALLREALTAFDAAEKAEDRRAVELRTWLADIP
ncbi:MAG: serine/threonine-protein kinase [Rhodothermales bacterium]